jgi:hypothetical protein
MRKVLMMPAKIKNWPLYKKMRRKGKSRKTATRKANQHPRKGK